MHPRLTGTPSITTVSLLGDTAASTPGSHQGLSAPGGAIASSRWEAPSPPWMGPPKTGTSVRSRSGDHGPSAPAADQDPSAPAADPDPSAPAADPDPSAPAADHGPSGDPIAARGSRRVPCNLARSAADMPSHRSMMAAAAGSVARAAAFSSSVRVITRSVRISSISVESNNAPALSGATAGWSYRMIGDAKTMSERPGPASDPASTGQQRSCRQSRAAASRPAGGSSSEPNTPRWTPSSRCAPRNDTAVAASR